MWKYDLFYILILYPMLLLNYLNSSRFSHTHFSIVYKNNQIIFFFMHVIYLPCITVVIRTCSTIFMTNENGYFFLVPNFTNKLFDQHIIYLGEHSMCTPRAVAKSCLTLFDPMNCRMLGFLILHYLPQFAQTHVHWVGDAIQPPHPLLTLSSALNLSKHQDLFQ